MSSLAASPGKENSMGIEKDVETKDLSKLLSDAKEVCSQIDNPEAVKADLTDAGDISGFNVLGNHAAVVDKLVASLDSALRLIRENETDTKEGRKGAIDVLNTAKDLSTGVETLCKATTSLLTQLTDGSKVTACFEQLAPSLGHLIEVPNAKQYKGLSSVVVTTSTKLLKKMETSSSGPYESSLLSASELFLSRCLNHSNFDLRRAVAAMWKTTFAESKELVYSEKMRSVLLVAAKRHSMFLPGLSVETIDEPKTPTSKLATTMKIRSSKKRVAALLDEDSVDYVPIQQTPGSTKKMKLTEHQKEVFANRMDKIPLMDEDSIQPGSLPNKLAEQFDVETSMSASQSIKKPAEQPRRTSPRLEDQKKTEAAVESRPKVASPKEVAEKTEEEPKEEKTPEDVVKKRKSAVKSPKEKKEGSGGKKASTRKKVQEEVERETEPESETSRDGFERRRGARRSLNMPSSKTDEKKKEKIPGKEEPVKTEEVGSISSSGSAAVESCSESSQDSSDAPSTRSRRSKAKGTPSKFVAKPRRSKAAETPDHKAGTPQIKRKRGRPSTKKAVPVEEEGEGIVISVAMNALGSPLAAKKKVEEPMDTGEVVEEAKEEKAVADEVPPVAQEIEAVAPVVEREKSPERGNDKKEDEDEFSTPKKAEDIFHTPVSSVRMTPGILKKANTPSTLEKRHRVHFTNEAIMRKEERNGIVATPKRTPGALDADDHRMNEPVFPLLAEIKDPVAKILNQICPLATHTATTFLRRALEQNHILTVGDLARATGKDISALPVKNPRYDTVKNSLKNYAETIGLVVSSSQKKKEENEVEVVFERVSPSPAKQEKRNLRSPVPAMLKELDPTPIIPSPPVVQNVEAMDTTEPVEAAAPTVAPENTDFAKLLGTLKSLSSSAKDLDLTTDLTAEQAKELLTSASETMSSLAALQNKLITRIA